MTITLENDAITIRNPKSHLQSGLVFGRLRELYAWDMRKVFAGVTTVAERALKYQKRETKQTELAKEISRRLGFSSDVDLAKGARGGGSLSSVSIPARDIRIATDKPDATAIKGKMRQSKNQHITFEEHTEWDPVKRLHPRKRRQDRDRRT